MSEYIVKPGESIQQAVGKLRAGDTLWVEDGTYREAVTISTSGTAAAPITIAARNTGKAIIDATGKAFGVNGIGASHITLKGVKINDANSGVQVNAALRVGANWIVEDVEVNRAGQCGIYVGGANSTFTRTHARDGGQQGWWVNANNITLKDSGATGNNTKKYNPAWEAGGVKFYITNGCTVDGGIWANNGGPAIWFDYQNRNFTVRNTEVYGNHGWNQAWAGVGIVAEISEGPGLFENNYVHDNTGDGIAVWEAMNVTIRDNRLVNDDIGWRDMTNRAPYRTKNNYAVGNNLTNGQIKTPPANANNVVTALVVPSQPPAPPAPASADGGTVPPSAALVDGRGIRWTLSGGKISRNGILDGVTSGVQLLLAWGGMLYQQAASGWWKAGDTIGQWTGAADPRPAEPTPPTPAPIDPRGARIAELEAEFAGVNATLAAANAALARAIAERDGARVDTVTITYRNGGQEVR